MTDQPLLSIGDLLPPQLENWREALKAASKDGVRLPTWPVVGAQADAAVRQSLAGYDLAQALASAWVSYRELASHRDDPPGQSAVVDLGNHQISIGASPTLTLSYDGVTFPPITVIYAITLAFDTVKLAVTGGYLIRAQPGDCTLSGGLSCGKVPLHPPLQTKPFSLPLIWTFDPKLRLPPPIP